MATFFQFSSAYTHTHEKLNEIIKFELEKILFLLSAKNYANCWSEKENCESGSIRKSGFFNCDDVEREKPEIFCVYFADLIR